MGAKEEQIEAHQNMTEEEHECYVNDYNVGYKKREEDMIKIKKTISISRLALAVNGY